MDRKDCNHLLKPNLLLELVLSSMKTVSKFIAEGAQQEITLEKASPPFLGLHIFTAFEFQGSAQPSLCSLNSSGFWCNVVSCCCDLVAAGLSSGSHQWGLQEVGALLGSKQTERLRRLEILVMQPKKLCASEDKCFHCRVPREQRKSWPLQSTKLEETLVYKVWLTTHVKNMTNFLV